MNVISVWEAKILLFPFDESNETAFLVACAKALQFLQRSLSQASREVAKLLSPVFELCCLLGTCMTHGSIKN